MLNEKQRAEYDQGTSHAGEMLSQMWRSIYHSCIKSGFSPEQSLVLVQTFILKGADKGVNGTGQVVSLPPPGDDGD